MSQPSARELPGTLVFVVARLTRSGEKGGGSAASPRAPRSIERANAPTPEAVPKRPACPAIPPRLAKETEDRLAEIQQRLDEISADRPIAYEYLTLGAQRRDGNILLSGVTLVLRNASDRTMAYTFKDVTLHVNEQAIGLKDQEEISGLIGHQQEMGYAVAPQEPGVELLGQEIGGEVEHFSGFAT